MKVLIAGPMPSDKNSGGVAVFTANLAKEISKNNDVLIVSKNKVSSSIPIISIWHIRKIKEFHPDIIISCLEYSFILSFFSISGKKVHILHGFPTFNAYSQIKFQLMHLIDKRINKKYDMLLANSKYTKYINESIFDLNVKNTFNIGLSDKELKEAEMSLNDFSKKENILYVGRLVKVKGVDLALKAFENLQLSNAQFDVVGYGPEESKLKAKYQLNKNIIFRGSCDHKKIDAFYKKAKVFISLNDAEPFGITYLEALVNGDFIIAPKIGGQVKKKKKFPDRCILVDKDNIEGISKAIKIGLKSNLSPLSDNDIANFSYKNTWNEILKALN